MNNVVLDDWTLRTGNAFYDRKRNYRITSITMLVILALFLVLTVFYLYVILAFGLLLMAFAAVVLEWLKVKNNHLQICENVIYITNRFQNRKAYHVEYKACTLVIQKSFDIRSGGIWLKFYDENNNLICKYEDMLNRTSCYGAIPTAWEKAVCELDMKVVDKSNIFMNEMFLHQMGGKVL